MSDTTKQHSSGDSSGDNDAWEYRIIKEGKLYKLVEDFGKLGYAEIKEVTSLEKLAQMIVDDFTSQIHAIKTYQEDTNSEGK